MQPEITLDIDNHSKSTAPNRDYNQKEKKHLIVKPIYILWFI